MVKTLFFLLSTLLMLSSCSEYQKVYKGEDNGKKYVLADSLYKIGKYKKSLKLMEQIVPAYRGKPQAERLMFLYANTYYKLEDFYLAGYQFERFEQAYPQSDSVQIASFKGAKSFYELSPRYSLDQKDTYKALEKLQNFINGYPESSYRAEANALTTELREKLEKKDYEIANQYYRIEDFKAAIESFENFINDHPGSSYRKLAFYGRLAAGYKLAINSVPSLVQSRLDIARGYYNSFIKYYADSDLKPDADAILQEIENRKTTITEENPNDNTK